MASAYSALGELAMARSSIKAALAIVEVTRARVAAEGLRQSYLAEVHDDYATYADVLMKLDHAAPGQDYEAQALEASERSRARSLLDLLSESQTSRLR
jgi:hypothetical protein